MMELDKITQIINQVSNRTISTDEAIEEILHLESPSKPVCDTKNFLLSPRQVDDKFTKEWAEERIWEYERCSPSQILAWGYRLGYEEARKHINYGKENI